MTIHSKKKALLSGIYDVIIYLKKNSVMVFLTVLILCGVTVGCAFYSILSNENKFLISSIMAYTTTPTDFISGCSAVFSSAFEVYMLIIGLFLLGLTPYGIPLIFLMPLSFGFAMGATECFYYETAGLKAVAITFLPCMIISSIAIMIACAQAFRMSRLFSCQLLPYSAHCGGMWQDFKMYIFRYLFCLFLAFAAAIVNVLLQTFL